MKSESPTYLLDQSVPAFGGSDRGDRGARVSSRAARPRFGWPALTETEFLVAQLIASGRTNRAAAQELHISIHTVSTHVRAVFTKLDLHSRVELANAWHRHSTSRST